MIRRVLGREGVQVVPYALGGPAGLGQAGVLFRLRDGRGPVRCADGARDKPGAHLGVVTSP